MEPKAQSSPVGQTPEQVAQPAQKAETGPVELDISSVEAAPQPAAVESDRPAGERANQNQGMPVQTPVVPPTNPLLPPVQDDTTVVDPKAVIGAAPDLANDVDVIEKEWVDKAKEIVKNSVDDPYKQNHNVSILKADYMKKRYGKDIKIPEDTKTASKGG